MDTTHSLAASAIPVVRQHRFGTVYLAMMGFGLIAAAALCWGMTLLLRSSQMQGKSLITLAPLGLYLIGILVLLDSRERKRRSSLQSALTAEGFEVIQKPTALQKQRAYEAIQKVYHLSHGPQNVKRFAIGLGVNAGAYLVEYEYLIGKAPQVFCAASVPIPESWPALCVISPRATLWIERDDGLHEVLVGDAAFQDAWHVRTASDEFARTIFTPTNLQLIATATKHEAWVLREGRLCCVFGARLDGESTVKLLHRAQLFLKGLQTPSEPLETPILKR